MIDTSAENLMAEVQDAIKERDKKLSAWKDSIDRYQGPDRSGTGNGNASPENVEFQYIARRVPQQAFDLPGVRCDSPRIDVADDVANFDRALNRWIHSSNLREVSNQTAVDFNFGWACILVNRKPREELGEVAMKGGKGVPYWPFLTRVSPTQAFKDPRGTSPYDYRFAGMPVVADKEDMLRVCDSKPEEQWIRESIEQMTDDGGLEKVGRRSPGSGPTRKEVTYYQVWVADAAIDWETECIDPKTGAKWPEDKRYLYNGKIFYFATTFPTTGTKRGKKTSQMIRKPQPYLGPPCGPFVFFGEHVVPDDPDFMSTLTPNSPTIRFMNEAIKTVNRGIAAYKRIGLVSDFADGLEEKIKNAPDLTIHTVSGLDTGMTAVLETGGVTNQMVAATDILRDRTDRGLGMDDGQYGRADDQASATAVAVAADSAGALADRAKAQYVDGIRRALEIVGFYLWYDEEFAVPISLQEAIALGDAIEDYVRPDGKGGLVFRQPMIFGGTDKSHSYASLQITIEPYSMERMSQAVAARNAATLVSTVATLLPLIAQSPGVNGPVLMKALSKYTRIPEMEHVFDWDVLAQLFQSQKLAEYAASLAQGQPELSGDSKTASTPKSAASATTPGATPARVQPAAAPKPIKPGGMQGRSTGGSAGRQAATEVKAA